MGANVAPGVPNIQNPGVGMTGGGKCRWNAKDQTKIDNKRKNYKWAFDLSDVVISIAGFFITKNPYLIGYGILRLGRAAEDLLDYSNTRRYIPNAAACAYNFMNNHYQENLGSLSTNNQFVEYQMLYNCAVGNTAGTSSRNTNGLGM